MICRLRELDEGIEIALVDAYGDGTVWAKLVDRRSRVAYACIDGRLGSETRFRLFDGDRYPAKPGTVLIDLGAEEEGLFISLVSRWIDTEPPRHHLNEFGLELVRNALLHVGTLTN
jgi:hypothetical protein